MMDKVFELLSNLVQIFTLVWFITNFFGARCRGIKKAIAFMIIWMVAFIQTTIINYIAVYDGFLALSVIITFIIYARLCLNGNLSSHVFISCFSMTIVFTLSSVLIFIFSYFTGINAEGMIANLTIWRIVAVCLCRLLEVVIFSFVLRINAEYSLTRKEWTLFITIPLFTWGAVIFMTQAVVMFPEVLPQMFYISVIMVMIDIVIYYFMFKIKQDTETKIEYELLKMQHDNMKKLEVNMKAIYDSTYSVKHDLEKHLLAVKTMAEKSSNTDICLYIDKIVDDGLNGVQKIVFTCNDIFNAIINTKLALCREKGITPNVSISDEAISYIEQSDIVILFGNIFDNAIEAAEKTDRKIIILDVRLQGEYVSIYMENSFDAKYSSVKLKSTKDNQSAHGIGIKNVRKIVEKHEGMIEHFQNEQDMFCCDILLKKHT